MDYSVKPGGQAPVYVRALERTDAPFNALGQKCWRLITGG
jgi:hypothetical protein